MTIQRASDAAFIALQFFRRERLILDFLGYAQLCAAGAGIGALFPFARVHRFLGNHIEVVIGVAPWLGPLRPVEPFPAAIAEKVFHDSVFQGMKSDDADARSGLESRSQNAQPLFEGAKFIIHFQPERLKNLRGRMTATAPADNFFDRIGQRKSLPERGRLPHLYDQACDATRSRFLPQLAEQLGQLLYAVLIYDSGGSQPVSWVHAHVKRTVAHETKTALRIFELPRGDTKIERRATDAVNSQFTENFVRVSKIRLEHGDAAAEASQLLAHMLDGIGVLIQGEDIGPGS